MSDSNSFVARVQLFKDGETRDLGEHHFITLPRVGEFIWVEDANNEYCLKVFGVTHFSDNPSIADLGIKRLNTRSVSLSCEE
jgi:hypothetical protein